MDSKEILKRLEEIEARAEKATPGPWSAVGAGRPDRYRAILASGTFVADVRTNDNGGAVLVISKEDMDLILNAREDISQLCKVVRRLVGRLEAVAEAAREVVRGSAVESKQSDGWERRCVWGPQWEHLAKSLAALEEENDGDL